MGLSIRDKKANELTLSYKNYYNKMVSKGFTPAQVAITSIVISINQYNLTKGVGAGISIICSCLNSFMEEKDFDITEISGYYQETDEKKPKEKNIIHLDFTKND